jgi:hypothetical protein
MFTATEIKIIERVRYWLSKGIKRTTLIEAKEFIELAQSGLDILHPSEDGKSDEQRTGQWMKYLSRGSGQLIRDSTLPARPVWIRIPEAVHIFGIKRTSLYRMINDQSIRSRVVKKHRDSIRGIRLISYDSLEEFINSAATK